MKKFMFLYFWDVETNPYGYKHYLIRNNDPAVCTYRALIDQNSDSPKVVNASCWSGTILTSDGGLMFTPVFTS